MEERSNERIGFEPLRRLELKCKAGVTLEEWQYLRAKVDEVVLTDPEATEGEYTDEDDD